MISRIDDSWQEKGQWLAEGRNRKSAMFHNLGWKLLAFQLKPQSDGLYLVGRQEGDFRIVPSSIAVFGSILQYCSMDDGSYGHCAKKESSSNLGHIWIYLISSAKTGLIALICVDLLCWFYIYQKEICSGLGWFGWFSWSRNQVSRCFGWHDTAGCRNFSPIRWMKPLPGVEVQQLIWDVFQIFPGYFFHFFLSSLQLAFAQKQGGLVHVAGYQQDG